MHEGEGRHAWFDEPATTTGSLLAVPTVPPPALPGDDDPEVVAHEEADDLDDLDDAGPDEDGLFEDGLVELVPVPRHPVHDLFRDPESGADAPRHTAGIPVTEILARLTVPPPVMDRPSPVTPSGRELPTDEIVTDEPPAPLARRRPPPPTPGRSARRRTNVFGRGNSRALGASTGV